MYPIDLTVSEIQALIPHRDPFFFLESAQLTSDNEILGKASWTQSNPILQGHFPTKPIVPGVCLIEAGAQLAGVLLHWHSQNLHFKNYELGVLANIQNAKFKRTLKPDEVLMLNCKVRALSPFAYWVRCSGNVIDADIFNCELLLAQKI